MRLTRIAIIVGITIGALAGVGGYTFVYAKGYSYLTNDPAACANCHMMSGYYAAWQRGPHRSVAVCNDCHTPHALTGKYLTKASNGFRHSFYFTSGRYPDNPEITARNRKVIEAACRRCHAGIVQAMDSRMSCVRCHADVGHM
jgi:cytochrome c nitrite reductase small subunit